jgi:protein-tyrosine phosphatase
LRTVIDMQGGVGRDPGPLVANGVNRHHLSIWDDYMQDLLMRLEQPISGEFYVTLAQRFAAEFTGALRLLSDEASYPAVFHCTIGKDRTGVLAALLLAILGVGDETIIEDYGLSNSAIAQIREHLLTLPDLSDDYKVRLDLTLAVEPLAIATMLDELRARHGSIEEFVGKHGLKEREIAQLHDVLLT